jgi:ABC-type multidrug transport system permease subunit
VTGALATTSFLLVVAALWFGCSNSAREIVGEWAVYHRERMVNLKVPSYVGSKLAVLGLISALQCLVLVVAVGAGCSLSASPPVLFGVLLLTALVGVGLGLVVSAVARSSEAAIGLTPLVLLPLVILGGLMQPVHEMARPMRALAELMPSRWAFEAILVAEAEARPPLPAPAVPPGIEAPQPGDLAERYFPAASRAGSGRAALVLLLMGSALFTAVGATLRARDVH